MTGLQSMDLHIHTTVSDGTDTPEALLSRVRALGLELFSVTDHDDVKGCRRILARRGADDPAFVTGVEFSCREGDEKSHILGYGFDPEAPPILALMEKGHRFRMSKVLQRLDFLKKTFGFAFPDQEIRALLALDNPGKPHIGNLMVKYGYAPSKNVAIKSYIDRLQFPSTFIPPEEAITAILSSGGIPVLAHPSFGSGGERIRGDEMDRRLRKLMGYGLQGVEAFYSEFSEELRQEVLGFAAKYDLYVTAGSDYHGKNKQISLGCTGLGPSAEWPEGLRRFLRALSVPGLNA